MLVAENHGKIVREAQGSEDYLTSAVFGHLRYIPPGVFWANLFEACKSVSADESSLASALRSPVHSYSHLQIHFWPKDARFGEPDLLLHFSGGNAPDLIVMIEVKLFSGKSNSDERDQLASYLQMLNDLRVKGIPKTQIDHRYLIYLTRRDSTAEIEESMRALPSGRRQLYRLQWQDVFDVARQVAPMSHLPIKMILDDITDFLRRRGLEYFNGFRRMELPALSASDGRFYGSTPATPAVFAGMRRMEWLEAFSIQRGGWL